MKENYEENETKFKYVKTRHENCHDKNHMFVLVAFGLIVFNPRSTGTVDAFNKFLFIAFSPCESFLDSPVIVAPEPLPCRSFSHDRAIRIRTVS